MINICFNLLRDNFIGYSVQDIHKVEHRKSSDLTESTPYLVADGVSLDSLIIITLSTGSMIISVIIYSRQRKQKIEET